MQLNKPSSRPATGGYALIITLAFLTVALISITGHIGGILSGVVK